MVRTVTRACVLFTVALRLTLSAQSYVEVSGQTEPFDLTAGAKAAWDNSTPVIHWGADGRPAKPFVTINSRVPGTLLTKGDAAPDSRCAVYSLAGRLVWATAFVPNAAVRVPAAMQPGYYIVRIESQRSVLFTRTFLTMR